MEKKKNKKVNISLAFMGIFAAVLIILLFYIVGVLIQLKESEMPKNGVDSSNSQTHIEKTGKFASYFPECGLINDKCLDASCVKYFLCNDKKYSVCEIYDCQEEFGIATEDEDGKINIKRKIKDERKKIVEIKNRCNGTLEILKSDCVEEKLEMQVQVNTAGNCVIEGFMAVYKIGEDASEKSFKPAKFSNLGNGIYLVRTSNCNEILELIAIGEAGVSIK